eukprot:GHRR01035926.1.p1 GENE.GHRR01035926.1~~GHRR01035926.1.p1  ORF type:complete len:125 (+),score=38.69 GHRR01035926.1:535-909(+)
MLSQGLPSAAKTLYAGFLSAALCSILVGSVHYCSFCVSKRLALQATNGDRSSNHDSAEPNHNANLMAAAAGALATALVESPVELFRHQAQAGVVGNNFLGEMVTSVRKQVRPVEQYRGVLLLHS